MSAPDPRFDGPGPDQQWQDTLAEGAIRLQRCPACAEYQFPPAVLCRACGQVGPEFVPVAGTGHVYSLTEIHTRDGTRNVAIVQLDEGPRLMSRIEGAADGAPGIGARVSAEIRQHPDHGHFLVFTPAEEASP